MKLTEKIIPIWGIFDIAAIGWYIVFRLLHRQIPIYADIKKAKALSVSFDAPLPSIFTIISIILYVSLIFSGILLLKWNKIGAILSYIQCPFRILTFIPISIFFLTRPVKYIFGIPQINDGLNFFQPSIIAFISIVLFSEVLKTTTIVRWHKMMNNKS